MQTDDARVGTDEKMELIRETDRNVLGLEFLE
jgi:hypothetical protein